MATDSVNSFLQGAQGLLESLTFKPPVIFILGPANAGKSTLVNSLAGQELSPADATPNTPAPIFIGHGHVFSARLTAGRKIETFDNGGALLRQLRKKKLSQAPERVEIEANSEILRWCTLVDTPGLENIKKNHPRLPGEMAGLAHGAIFLFHQRGMDMDTYHFLNSLSRLGKMPLGIIFLVNINLSRGDGSSISFTESRLREILPGQGRVHGISATDPGCAGLLAMHIKVRIFSHFLRQYEKELQGRDSRLPGLLRDAVRQQEDHKFLLKLWPLVEEWENICNSRRTVLSLPGVSGRMDELLAENSARLLKLYTAASPISCPPPLTRAPDLSSLLEKISRDAVLAPYLKPGWINEIQEKAAAKKCTLVAAGSFSTGKTTFINALLGESLLPAGDSATTSCPVLITRGEKKEALVTKRLQISFTLLEPRGGVYHLQREEARALALLLEEPIIKDDPPDAEAASGGAYTRVPLEKLRQMLAGTFSLLSRLPALQENHSSLLKLPLAAREVCPGHLEMVTSVRLTFKNQKTLFFNLEDNTGRQQFIRAISHPLSLLVEEALIRHPAPLLQQANLLDTPGLDSLQPARRQRPSEEYTGNYILLHFFNGKNLAAASSPELLQLKDTRSLTTAAFAENKPGINLQCHPQSAEKMPASSITVSSIPPGSIAAPFYIINFADTLTGAQIEKVSWHIRNRALAFAGDGKPAPYPSVHAVSPTQALQGQDESFNRLVAALMRAAQNARRRMLEGLVPEIKQQLTGAARRAGEADSDTASSTLIQQWINRYIKELSPAETTKINFKS